MLPLALMNVMSGDPEISRSNFCLLSAILGYAERVCWCRELPIPTTLSYHRTCR
jgi:hypothetical protein